MWFMRAGGAEDAIEMIVADVAQYGGVVFLDDAGEAFDDADRRAQVVRNERSRMPRARPRPGAPLLALSARQPRRAALPVVSPHAPVRAQPARVRVEQARSQASLATHKHGDNGNAHGAGRDRANGKRGRAVEQCHRSQSIGGRL